MDDFSVLVSQQFKYTLGMFPLTNTLLVEKNSTTKSSQKKPSLTLQEQPTQMASPHPKYSETPHFNTNCQEATQSKTKTKEEKLTQLLTSPQHTQLQEFLSREEARQSSHQMSADQDSLFNGASDHSESVVAIDYEEQLRMVKQNMLQIESYAQQEIVRLKAELDKERRLRLQAQSTPKPPSVRKFYRDTGINTEPDYLQQELSVLKTALLRHTQLNKQLLTTQRPTPNDENAPHCANLPSS